MEVRLSEPYDAPHDWPSFWPANLRLKAIRQRLDLQPKDTARHL